MTAASERKGAHQRTSKRSRQRSPTPVNGLGSLCPSFLGPPRLRSTFENNLTITSKFGVLLKEQQLCGERCLYNVFGLQVSMTIRDKQTRDSLERVKACITSNISILGITTFSVSEGLVACISSQIRAAIIGIPDINKPPPALIKLLEDPSSVWIVDDGWDCSLRRWIGESRLLELSTFHPKSEKVKSVADLLRLLNWSYIRSPKERASNWNNFCPGKRTFSGSPS